ncbi:helix-turn-helix domain-containing protein [Chlorogloeopsis sp. ULAP02]|uniref:winged helix-turn-helix transcriptional regulator n=1 Tax=Chlorogloeopsis sp. ULAP02 TaxID=3107926 RepID=UPI00313695EF
MTQLKRSYCPIASTLDLIGDRWTLLVIRDMMFFGKQRFEEFLESPEGISTNILANRLKSLEDLGLIVKQPYGNHPRRMNYQLTEQGQSLRPVLIAMIEWGLEHIPETMIPKGGSTQNQDGVGEVRE